jgi:hypothetical protein
LGLSADDGRQTLGFRFLFRGEKKVDHENLRDKRKGVNFQNLSASGFTVRKIHPLFSCLPNGDAWQRFVALPHNGDGIILFIKLGPAPRE